MSSQNVKLMNWQIFTKLGTKIMYVLDHTGIKREEKLRRRRVDGRIILNSILIKQVECGAISVNESSDFIGSFVIGQGATSFSRTLHSSAIMKFNEEFVTLLVLRSHSSWIFLIWPLVWL